jgi:hypothetical protein
MDYVQIHQLVARCDYALNTDAEERYAYADLFTADGELVKPHTQAREQLAAFARDDVKEQATAKVRDFVANLFITPTLGGAIRKTYMVAFNVGDSGKPSVVMNGGHDEDVYVRTAVGWRLKEARFRRKESRCRALTAGAAVVSRSSRTRPLTNRFRKQRPNDDHDPYQP